MEDVGGEEEEGVVVGKIIEAEHVKMPLMRDRKELGGV